MTPKANTNISGEEGTATPIVADTPVVNDRRQQREEPAMEKNSTKEVFTQAKDRTVETMALWADANQRIVRELADFSAGTAKEGVQLYAELQQMALRSVAEAPVALPWEPAAWQDGYHKAFKLFEGNVQAVSRAAQRLQTSAEQTGKNIQESFSAVATKMKDLYNQN